MRLLHHQELATLSHQLLVHPACFNHHQMLPATFNRQLLGEEASRLLRQEDLDLLLWSLLRGHPLHSLLLNPHLVRCKRFLNLLLVQLLVWLRESKEAATEALLKMSISTFRSLPVYVDLRPAKFLRLPTCSHRPRFLLAVCFVPWLPATKRTTLMLSSQEMRALYVARDVEPILTRLSLGLRTDVDGVVIFVPCSTRLRRRTFVIWTNRACAEIETSVPN